MALDYNSVGGYLSVFETLNIPDSVGANALTINGSTITASVARSAGEGKVPPADIGGQKIMMMLGTIVVTGGLDAAVEAKIFGSGDGTNFVELATTAFDHDNKQLVTSVAVMDLTTFGFPYYRVQLTTDAVDTVDAAGYIKYTVTFKHKPNL